MVRESSRRTRAGKADSWDADRASTWQPTSPRLLNIGGNPTAKEQRALC